MADLVDGTAFEVAETHHDVSHLHAGVVDVVLDLDRHSAEPQDPDERVAEGRVAEVADVRGLVGVDGRVLHDRLAGADRRSWRVDAGAEKQKGPAIEVEVEVAVRGRHDPVDARDGLERGRDRVGDRARRFPEQSGDLESHGHAQIAHRSARRHVDRERRDLGHAEVVAKRRGNGAMDVALKGEDHARGKLRLILPSA